MVELTPPNDSLALPTTNTFFISLWTTMLFYINNNIVYVYIDDNSDNFRQFNFKEIVRNCYNCRLSSCISANWLFIDDNTDDFRQLFYIDCITLKKLSEIVIIVVYHSTYQPIDCLLTTTQTILDNYFYRLRNFKEIVRNCYNCRLSFYISANWLFVDDNTDNLRQLFLSIA